MPSSIADRLLSIYQHISHARLALVMALRKEPANPDCQRVHDVARFATEQTLSDAMHEISELIRDIRDIQLETMKGLNES